MARKKNKPVEEIAPEDESQDVPDHEDGANVEQEGETAAPMKKAEAARLALDAGMETYKDAAEFALKKLRIELKPGDFAQVKNRARKQAGEKTAKPAKRGRPAAAPAAPRATPTPRAADPAPQNGNADILEGLQTLKGLISHFGADQVRKMMDVLE